jgi:hypothetical protein
MNPEFVLAKDYIMEGLSLRLNHYEQSTKKPVNINLKPRKNYGAEMEKHLIENFA